MTHSPLHAAALGITLLALLAPAACSRGDSPEPGAGTPDSARTASAAAAGNVGWAMYNHDYDSQRFSNLNQITAANVAGLKPVCEVKLGEMGTFQSGPLVRGDTIVVTTAHSTAALNATNCALIWRNVDQPKAKDVFPVNRGAAYLDGRYYRGTTDGRLVALDAKTGNVVWENPVGNPAIGEFISSAPVAWKGTVFVGVAGSDWGVRGHVMAFDAATGKEKWRFYTVPMGSDPGAETWKIPATAQHGGGAQWTSYTIDTAASELFVSSANPAPDFAPHTRPGDNLYTNSLVVLDVETGKLAWYHQLDPHDGLDWDLGAAAMLYDAGSGPRVALGSKDGNVYSLDRTTHRPVFTTPVTTISNANATPTAKGVNVCPGPLGGVEWNGPAYDPQTRMIYVGAVDWCGHYVTTTSKPEFTPGQLYMGTSYAPVTGSARGWVTAMDAETGKVKWKFHAPQPVVAGVTPTAGGIVLNGDLAGNFYAFDATTGKVLLTLKLTGAIAGGVVTYAVGGKQYVATTSGNISRTTFTTTGTPTLVIMSLNAPETPHLSTLPSVTASPPSAESTATNKPGETRRDTSRP